MLLFLNLKGLFIMRVRSALQSLFVPSLRRNITLSFPTLTKQEKINFLREYFPRPVNLPCIELDSLNSLFIDTDGYRLEDWFTDVMDIFHASIEAFPSLLDTSDSFVQLSLF